MRHILIAFLAVVLALVFAAPAGADKPDCTDPDSTHPTCQDDGDDEEPTLEACPTGTFTVPGIRQTDFECLWKPAFVAGQEVATVTINNPPEGGIPRPPTLFVRDDGPGDICIFEYQWENQDGPEYVESFDLVYNEVPVPTPDDPDVLDYSAWLGQSYWDFIKQEGMEPGTHWCAPQDPILWNIREDNNGGALLLTVTFDAKRGGSLDITLFPENSL
jgi:hypothetical protein